MTNLMITCLCTPRNLVAIAQNSNHRLEADGNKFAHILNLPRNPRIGQEYDLNVEKEVRINAKSAFPGPTFAKS